MAQKIVLKGDYTRKEAVASSAITPGELIEFGGSNDVQAASTAADTSAPTYFALRNDLVGDGIGDDYDSGDTVQYAVPVQGTEVNAFLAHGENVSKGDALESDGNGDLQKFTSGRIIAFALEALNNTSGSPSRIEVEVA